MSKLIALIGTAVLLFTFGAPAQAFWGGAAPDGASGLDVAGGFDINTISTFSGAVLTPPERVAEGQRTLMTVSSPQGTVTVVLGPWWFWEQQKTNLARGQELSLTGSLAQGKDGALYLFAQSLMNRGTGDRIILRTESGKPLWSREQSVGGPRGGGLRNGLGRGSGMRGGRR